MTKEEAKKMGATHVGLNNDYCILKDGVAWMLSAGGKHWVLHQSKQISQHISNGLFKPL